MIYFDNAATGGWKPDEVLRSVRATLTPANPGRSGHRLAVSAAKTVFRAREIISSYFHFPTERVIFTKNCTEALNIALTSLSGHVVTTELEHNSVLRPLFARGNVSICPLTNGKLNVDTLLSLVKDDTEAVVLTLASNVTGYAPNVEEIRKRLKKDVLLIGDGAQFGGHRKLPDGLDAVCFAGHKGLLGIQGSGLLLFSERFKPFPLLHGGTGTESLSKKMPSVYPERLEAGTLNLPAIVSLLEGVLYLKTNGEHDLTKGTKLLIEGLSTLPVKVYSEPNPFGIVSFSSEKLDSETLSSLLSEEFGICVRGGYHCAPLIHKAIDEVEGGSVRVSLGVQNQTKEISFFLAAMRKLLS